MRKSPADEITKHPCLRFPHGILALRVCSGRNEGHGNTYASLDVSKLECEVRNFRPPEGNPPLVSEDSNLKTGCMQVSKPNETKPSPSIAVCHQPYYCENNNPALCKSRSQKSRKYPRPISKICGAECAQAGNELNMEEVKPIGRTTANYWCPKTHARERGNNAIG